MDCPNPKQACKNDLVEEGLVIVQNEKGTKRDCVVYRLSKSLIVFEKVNK